MSYAQLDNDMGFLPAMETALTPGIRPGPNTDPRALSMLLFSIALGAYEGMTQIGNQVLRAAEDRSSAANRGLISAVANNGFTQLASRAKLAFLNTGGKPGNQTKPGDMSTKVPIVAHAGVSTTIPSLVRTKSHITPKKLEKMVQESKQHPYNDADADQQDFHPSLARTTSHITHKKLEKMVQESKKRPYNDADAGGESVAVFNADDDQQDLHHNEDFDNAYDHWYPQHEDEEYEHEDHDMKLVSDHPHEFQHHMSNMLLHHDDSGIDANDHADLSLIDQLAANESARLALALTTSAQYSSLIQSLDSLSKSQSEDEMNLYKAFTNAPTTLVFDASAVSSEEIDIILHHLQAGVRSLIFKKFESIEGVLKVLGAYDLPSLAELELDGGCDDLVAGILAQIHAKHPNLVSLSFPWTRSFVNTSSGDLKMIRDMRSTGVLKRLVITAPIPDLSISVPQFKTFLQGSSDADTRNTTRMIRVEVHAPLDLDVTNHEHVELLSDPRLKALCLPANKYNSFVKSNVLDLHVETLRIVGSAKAMPLEQILLGRSSNTITKLVLQNVHATVRREVLESYSYLTSLVVRGCEVLWGEENYYNDSNPRLHLNRFVYETRKDLTPGWSFIAKILSSAQKSGLMHKLSLNIPVEAAASVDMSYLALIMRIVDNSTSTVGISKLKLGIYDPVTNYAHDTTLRNRPIPRTFACITSLGNYAIDPKHSAMLASSLDHLTIVWSGKDMNDHGVYNSGVNFFYELLGIPTLRVLEIFGGNLVLDRIMSNTKDRPPSTATVLKLHGTNYTLPSFVKLAKDCVNIERIIFTQFQVTDKTHDKLTEMIDGLFAVFPYLRTVALSTPSSKKGVVQFITVNQQSVKANITLDESLALMLPNAAERIADAYPDSSIEFIPRVAPIDEDEVLTQMSDAAIAREQQALERLRTHPLKTKISHL